MRRFPGLLIAATALAGAVHAADFHDWAPTPPMGWNSWDAFATTLTDARAREEADVMARLLAPHGWQYLVVDIQWYEPGSTGFEYRPNATLAMDGNGRLIPAENKFPSSAGGAGFRPLADYVHARGLKFGIHLMRGIPRQAVERNLPIVGTTHHAAEIADRVNVCPWNSDMDGVDMTKPGAQEYYDSVFSLIASWGVDFVKMDDLSRPYVRNEPEIEAVRRAIDRTGRPMVLSLSPGETDLHAAAHAVAHANLWRISDDFWDHWSLLEAQFDRLNRWSRWTRPGAWPDADMLPIGTLELGRQSWFSHDEEVTLLTLWSIARSPLILGADMTKLDPQTLSLLTNDEVLAVNQRSSGNHQLFRRADGAVGWVADAPKGREKYVALFKHPRPVGPGRTEEDTPDPLHFGRHPPGQADPLRDPGRRPADRGSRRRRRRFAPVLVAAGLPAGALGAGRRAGIGGRPRIWEPRGERVNGSERPAGRPPASRCRPPGRRRKGERQERAPPHFRRTASRRRT